MSFVTRLSPAATAQLSRGFVECLLRRDPASQERDAVADQ